MAAPETIGVLVPADNIARVIGKQGAGLKAIREEAGCKISCKAEPEEGALSRRMNLIGTSEQICIGFRILLLKAFPDAGNTSTPQLLIPSDKAGMAIGRGGENLKKVREECGVRITVEREPVTDAATGDEERMITMQGEVSQMGRALCHILGAPIATGRFAANVPGGMAMLGMGGQGWLGMPLQSSQGVRPAGTDPEEIQLHFVVPERLAGAVLGKGGAQMKQTAATAECKVSMTPREAGTERRAVVVGTYSQCVVAQNLLQEQILEAASAAGVPAAEVSVVFMIRREAAGALIGKQGDTLKKIRDESGARIQLQRKALEGQRPCILSGELQQVLQAEKAIYEVVKEIPVEPVLPGSSDVAYAAAALGAFDSFHRPDLVQFAGKGRGRGKDEAAETTRLLVPAQCAGGVIGRQGSGLKELRETTGAQVEMLQPGQAPQWPNDRLLILKGSLVGRQAAVQAVLRMAFQAPGRPASDQCVLKLLVTPSQAGGVIGRQGATLKRVREQCGISIQVEREEVLGERLITATGPAGSVAAAAAALLPLTETPGGGGRDADGSVAGPSLGGQGGLATPRTAPAAPGPPAGYGYPQQPPGAMVGAPYGVQQSVPLPGLPGHWYS